MDKLTDRLRGKYQVGQDYFPIGSYAKCTMSGRVFEVAGYSNGNTFVPDGWLVDRTGFTANPRFCEPYKGAS